MSKLLDEVVSELSRLPGIGRRTAMRLAMHLLRMEPRDVELMSESISRFRTDIRYCSRCNNLSDDDLCEICADTSRDASTVCVVEQVKDLLSIENTRQYNGLYHVLGGVISPMQGIGPSDLKIDPAARPYRPGRRARGDSRAEHDGRGRDDLFLHYAASLLLRGCARYVDRPRYRLRR